MIGFGERFQKSRRMETGYDPIIKKITIFQNKQTSETTPLVPVRQPVPRKAPVPAGF
jgi:hypothetical protein